CSIGTRLKGCSARWLGLPISGSRSWNVYGTSLCVRTSRTMLTKVLRGKPYTITSDMLRSFRLILSPNRHREVDRYSRSRGRLLRCAGQAKLLAKSGEGRLHLVKMRMLASTHPFVFGAKKSSFIGFPGL